MKRAGGDEENARSIRFPKSYEEGRAGELVNIKGSKKLVPKIKEELETELARLKSQVCYAVRINRASQPGLIGRGASGLKSLQNKFQVTIHAPGWKEWSLAPEPMNNDEFKEVDPAEIFKVVGSKEACLAAADQMKVSLDRAFFSLLRLPSEVPSEVLSFELTIYDGPVCFSQIRVRLNQRSVHLELQFPSPLMFPAHYTSTCQMVVVSSEVSYLVLK